MSDGGRLSGERLARVALSCLSEPGDPQVARSVAQIGAEQTLRDLRPGGDPDDADAQSMVDRAARAGVRLVWPGSADWPTQLDDLAAPPLVLYVRGGGDLRGLALRSVGVVGSRDTTGYGRRIARRWARGLAAGGWTVISGAAFGIDAAAHRGALDVSGPTVAVLAGGVSPGYPRSHEELFDDIARQGVLVSETPVGMRPRRHWFLQRNRIIAALTRGVVVVEAGLRSGALSTVRHAHRLNRVVGAVPGPVDSPNSQGVLRLLRDQEAVAVVDEADVISLLSPLAGEDLLFSGATPADDPGRGPSGQGATVTKDHRAQVLAVLRGTQTRLTLGELSAHTGLAMVDLVPLMARAESSGLVVRRESGWELGPG